MGAARKAEDYGCQFLHSLVRPLKRCLAQHVARASASANEGSPTIVEIICSVEMEIRYIVPAQSVVKVSFKLVWLFLPVT